MSRPRKKSLTPPNGIDAGGSVRCVAVTGAYGYLGTEIIRLLEQDERIEKIVAIDIRKPRLPLKKSRFHKVDLTQPTSDATVAQIFKEEAVDTVFHMAFLTFPVHDTSYGHELETIGTIHVLSACEECHIRRLITWSQTLVYGAHPLNPNFLSENHALRGNQSSAQYIRDKVDADKQVRRFRTDHPTCTTITLRTAALLGPTVDNFATRFFARPFAPLLLGFDPLMQFVHERDAVTAFYQALWCPDFSGELNITGDGVLPYSTLLALMGKVAIPVPHMLAYPIWRSLWMTKVSMFPPEFLDFLRFLCVVDGSAARKVLGFEPIYSIKAIVQDYMGTVPQSRYATASLPGAS